MSLSLLAVEALIGTKLAAMAGSFGIHRLAQSREGRLARRTPPEGRMIEVDGIELHYRIDGTGEDLVLIHGAGGNIADFDQLMPALTPRYRVLRIDRPGLGWSGHPKVLPWQSRGLGPVEQARLLASAAGRLGFGPAVVLGHSYGGAVALAWALERPDTAAALVALSAVSIPGQRAANAERLGLASRITGPFLAPLITAFLPRKSMDAILARIFAPQLPPADYFSRIGPLALRRAALRHNARQVLGLPEAIAAMAARYDAIACPVEIVHGTEDAIVPFDLHALPLDDRLRDSRLTALSGIGHMPHHAVPEAVIDAIDRAAARARQLPSPGPLG